MRSLYFLAWTLLAATALNAQGIGCLTEFLVPTYPSLAKQAAIGAEVEVRFSLDAGTRKVTVHSTSSLFQEQMERHFRLAAERIAPACADREFSIHLTFQIHKDAKPTGEPVQQVWLNGERRIVIISPRAPMNFTKQARRSAQREGTR